MADNEGSDDNEEFALLQSKVKHVQSLGIEEKMERLVNMVEELHVKNNATNGIISEMTNSLETRITEKIEGLRLEVLEALSKGHGGARVGAKTEVQGQGNRRDGTVPC